jgi:hypothetical protein
MIVSLSKTNLCDYELFTYLPLDQLQRQMLSYDVKQSNFNIAEVVRDSNNKINMVKYSSGNKAYFTYKNVGNRLRLVNTQYYSVDGSLLESWEYEYNENNKLKSIINTFMKDKTACAYMKEDDFSIHLLQTEKDMKIVEYDSNDNLYKVTYDDGNYLIVSRDDKGKVKTINWYNSDNTLTNTWTFTRNAEELIQSIVNT